MSTTATSRLEVRFTEDAKERLVLAAELADENPSEFVRRAVEVRAQQILQEHRETRVSPDFFDELLAALDQPAEPNEALTRAFTRTRDVVKRA